MAILILPTMIVCLWGMFGTFYPHLKGWKRHHFASIAIVSIIILVILGQFNSRDARPENVSSSTNTSGDAGTATTEDRDPTSDAEAQTNSREGEAAQRYAQQLERELQVLRDQPRMPDIEETDAGVLEAFVLLNLRVGLIGDAPHEQAPEQQAMLAEYIRRVTAFQRDLFPRLRRVQAEIWRQRVWEADVEVETGGPRATTVTFIGAIFAANRNIAEVHQGFHDPLVAYRFRRAEYRWIRQDRYSYYEIDSLGDEELALLNDDGQWEPIDLPGVE